MEMITSLGAYGWAVIPVGLFLGLLGYRLYRVSLFLIGLFFGFALGLWIGESIDNAQLGLILGIFLGLALGIATHFLIRFSLFLGGMAAGVVIASMVLPYTTVLPESLEALLWTLGAAVLTGLLTLVLYKFLILFATSLIGTFLIYQGTSGYFPPEAESWSWILYVVLLLVFIMVQAGGRKGHPDPVERDRSRRRR